MNFNNILGIVPARKNSKRLPHKNTQPVGGIPLVKRTILTAKSAGLSKIIVTTDDSEVKEIALKENIVVVDRPSELATDDARGEDAFLHAMEYVDNELNWDYDTICALQVTSPLLKSETLKKALETFYNEKLTSLVAVNSTSFFKPCGAFYCIKKATFLKEKTFWIDDLAVFPLNAQETIDVDHLWDWAISNAVANGRIFN